MITKEGYVFIAAFGDPLIEHLFGPATNKPRKYINLQSNRLTLFEEESMARKVMEQYERIMKKSIPDLRVTPAQLWMKIAETEDEARRVFAKSRDLVVIAYNHSKGGVGDILMGRRVEGKPEQYPLYGAEMIQNGFAPIRNLNDAAYIASEAHRQAGFGIKLARFKLKRLKS